MKKWMLCMLFFSLLASTFVMAATTGKISGSVVDAETGEPLPGVNVIVEGTNLGAATDEDGSFFILRVPPGEYKVKATYMGYKTQSISNVRVSTGRTTELDFELEQTVIETGEEVVVVAQREKIKKDVSFSQTAMASQEVVAAPTGTDIRATIDMAPSIDRNDDTGNILIRGSFADEVGLVVDDFAKQDERHGTPIFKVTKSAIEEIQILTGGFSAEYGQARSGLINIVTKEGGNKYHGTIDYRFRPGTEKHIGPNVHSRGNWWEIGRFQFLELREPGQAMVGDQTLSGYKTYNSAGDEIFVSGGQMYEDWGGFENRMRTNWRGEEIPEYTNEYGENVDANRDGEPDFVGWNARYAEMLANRRMTDVMGVDKNTLTPEELLQAEKWFFRPFDYTHPDNYVELSFGGPVPFTNNKLTFFLDAYLDQQSFPVKVSKPNYIDDFIRLKLKYNLSPSMVLRYRGSYGEMQTVSFGFYEANFDPRNTTSSSNYFLRNQCGKNMFNWGSRSAAYYKWAASNGLRFTHIISPETFWEVNFQYNQNVYSRQYDMGPRDLNTPATQTTVDSTPVYLSEAPYGVYESFSGANIAPGEWTDENGITHPVWNVAPEMGQHNFGYMNENQDDSWYQSYILKTDMTSQLNDVNELKAGFNLEYNLMHIKSGYDDEFVKNWGRQSWKPMSEVADYNYFEGGAYLEDKIEFEGMIMNLGLRGDFYKAETPYFTDMWNYYYGTNATEFNASGEPVSSTIYSIASDSLEHALHNDAPFKWAVGPRIGVSHPISENAKIFFNYGYFFQRANTDAILVNNSNPYWPLAKMSNPALDFRKNINYEFGVEQNIADIFTYRVTGYYKDIYNEISTVFYKPTTGIYPTGDDNGYNRPQNNMYRDIRGIETEINARFLDYFQARLNYNYMLTRRGYYGFKTIYQDPFKVNELEDPDAFQPKPQPILRFTLLFHSPLAQEGASFMDRLKADWEISTYFRWEAGEWFRWDRGEWGSKFPGQDQNVQWTPYYNGVDLRVYKGFELFGVKMRAYTSIRNLMNSKQLLRTAFNSVRNPGFTITDYMDYLETQGKFEPGWYDDELEDILMRATPYYAIFKRPREIVYGLQINF